MRFACQSCGKAYNLPEEKIAEIFTPEFLAGQADLQ